MWTFYSHIVCRVDTKEELKFLFRAGLSSLMFWLKWKWNAEATQTCVGFLFNFYFKLILSFLSWQVSCISWTLVDYLCKCDKQSFSKIINETSLLPLPIELHCCCISDPSKHNTGKDSRCTMMSKIRGRLRLYFSRLGLFLPTHLLLYIFSIVLRHVNMIPEFVVPRNQLPIRGQPPHVDLCSARLIKTSAVLVLV